MNSNVSRNDFLFFQNEVFKDIKDIEKKLTEKITTLSSNIDSNKESSDLLYQKFNEKISQIITMVETSEERLKIDEQLSSFKKKVDDALYTDKAKITALEKELNNITFKYDKIFLDNMSVPGVIGTACPFQNLSAFIEYVNKKIKELLVERSKQNTDMRSYKEKLETIIASFQKQIKNVENQFIEYCNNSLKEYEKHCNERNNLVEEKVENMRIENGKYSYDLIQKSKELKIKWEKIQSIEDVIYKRFNEELVKHVYTSNNLCKIFNSQRDEFRLLKNRFTELSDFIKDVRFRNNITNLQNETDFQKKVKFKNISKRINFNLKQKLDINDKKDNSLDNINKVDYFQNNKENTFNNSYNLIENNTTSNYNNKKQFRQKSGMLLNKPMNLGKVSSTLKTYFNQNKEYKTPKYKNNRIFPKFLDDKIENKIENENNKIGKNKLDKNKDKESDYFSGEEDIKHDKKSNLKKRIFLQSAKNSYEKNKNIILVKNEEKNEDNDNKDEDKENEVLNSNRNIMNKSSKILPIIGLKKESINTFSINKSRNLFLNIKLNSIYKKSSKRATLFKELKNLKIEKIDNNLEYENKKSFSSKNLEIYPNENFNSIENLNSRENINSANNINSNDLIIYNTTDEYNSKIPALTINQIENIINSIINKNTNNTNNNNNNDENINNNPINNNTNNNNDDENNSNIKRIRKQYSNELNNETEESNTNIILPKWKRKIKNMDNLSIENNLNNNFENENKLIINNKFSFLTSQNIKQMEKQNSNNNNMSVNDMNINFYYLTKKISKTNKKINEVYKDLDIKINKLYKYFKKIFGELSGRIFYNETHKEKLFNAHLPPKTIFTASKYAIPIPEIEKRSMFSNEIDRIIKEKKFYSPKNLKQIDSFKSIVNQIEPYLIKKFKT